VGVPSSYMLSITYGMLGMQLSSSAAKLCGDRYYYDVQ